ALMAVARGIHHGPIPAPKVRIVCNMNREILRLAIPNIVSNISIPLLSTVDTALMGRLSELHLGAVGVGAMVFNIVYWNFGFLRMGTTGITAQAYGRDDRTALRHTFVRAVMVALGIALLILLLQIPLAKASLYLMNVEDQQYQLVYEYFMIRVWAAPASLSLYAFMGWFFGMQNAVFPLIITLVINVVNIILSYVLVQYAGMDVDGVAWGTVVAQYVGLLLAGILFASRYGYLLQTGNETTAEESGWLQWSAFRQFLSINGDIFLRTVCLSFAFGFFYSQSAGFDELTLAVNVILLQFLNWMSYGVDGFAFASESLVGKYHGASDAKGMNRAIRRRTSN
ncbi:MAG: MATE family efflux transporter, partial [Bacteroidota bacterium]